jgi:hypothetical protein
VQLALGIDGAKYVVDHARAFASAFDPFGFMEPLGRAFRKRLGEVSGGKDVTSVLGFDPLAMLRALLSR